MNYRGLRKTNRSKVLWAGSTTGYAAAISRGHCFNDGNKRTAHQSIDVCLDLHGIEITWTTEEAGNKIISLAQGLIHEDDLADWLRA